MSWCHHDNCNVWLGRILLVETNTCTICWTYWIETFPRLSKITTAIEHFFIINSMTQYWKPLLLWHRHRTGNFSLIYIASNHEGSALITKLVKSDQEPISLIIIPSQMQWKFRFLLIQILKSKRYKIKWQLCCCGMCKSLLRYDDQEWDYSKTKCSCVFNCDENIVSETGASDTIRNQN